MTGTENQLHRRLLHAVLVYPIFLAVLYLSSDYSASHPWVIHSVAVLTFFLSAYRFHLIQNSADADIARKLQFCVLATGLVYGLFGCDGRSVRVRELAVGSLDDLPECDRGRQCSYPRPQLKTEPMVPGFVADALVWRPPVSRRVTRILDDRCVRAFPGVPPQAVGDRIRELSAQSERRQAVERARLSWRRRVGRQRMRTAPRARSWRT